MKLNKNLEVPELVKAEERHNVYYFIAKVNNNLQVAEMVNVFHFCITQINRLSNEKKQKLVNYSKTINLGTVSIIN